MSRDVRHHVGQAGEELACEHLARLGYDILERNYRTRWGELDIVAYDGRALVFCEVKTRRAPFTAGSPLEAVGTAKRAQLRKMAARWLVERRERPYANELRFDVVGINVAGDGRLIALEHVERAF